LAQSGNHRDFRYSVTAIPARTHGRITAPKAARLTLTRRAAPVRQKAALRAAA
jgi:hypothetical protein